ncbi:hypothetical protein LTR37_019971 [Vermiconidia calcicola]|uniref:Uncharacterized protein n=1 Tax=Vermiconidia calcicola TaxID=1690605 RepID=A0ACC3MCK0_9PEZI|nr:hypothetical protein LTR37_019971 [Vermiconidia calcicola]
MAPIRLAIIGLSQSAKTSWASEGHLPYLLSERGRERYKIVALLNSSESAAKKAIEAYNLPSDVRPYGSPHDLAADPDVDLVVNTTRVDVHYDTIKPSIEAGKNAFVEWPLAENVSRATELSDSAKQSGSKTMIGLQARVAPSVLKLKQLLQAGIIGRVLSSDVQAFSLRTNRDSISEGLSYFLQKRVGGSPMTIAFGHMIDFIHSVLGEFASSNAHLQIQRPDQTIIDAETGATRPTVSDVPDLVSVHGTLRDSEYVAEGASLIVKFLTGAPFPGTSPYVWTITGEKGRLRVWNESGPFTQSEGSAFPTPIEVEDFTTGEVRQESWDWEDWQVPLSPRGRNIAKLYDLYYEGRTDELGVAGFSGAVVRHTQLDRMLY